MKKKQKNKRFKLLSYLLMLPVSFFIVALIWSLKIEGSNYVCTDQLPILNFIPPFVHGTQYGDYYLSSTTELYGTWVMFIVYAFISPLYPLSLFAKDKDLLKKAIILTVLVPIAFFVYAFSQATSSPPSPPTRLNILNADYRIVKLGENYAISFNHDEDVMYVGTSKVNLALFVNQRVVIDGSYSGEESPEGGLCELTKQQCIKGQCHDLFKSQGSVCKLDIESIVKKS